MNIKGRNYHTIWVHPENDKIIQVIDQTALPFDFKIKNLTSEKDAYIAISDMIVRGAPLIGVTGAYGIYLALLNCRDENNFREYITERAGYLKSARPTAVNLAILIDEILDPVMQCNTLTDAVKVAFHKAAELKEREIEWSEKIGNFGCNIIEEIYNNKGETVNILTHCNAGWLACIDWGTATAPIYKAARKGIPVHVWVDETRPRNQGARLTAWELKEEDIPHTIISDNTGGHLMQHGMVDMCIVGSDRTTVTGDVANKIGTYLKALAAHDNGIPFYVALPSSTIDFSLTDGIGQIPIEQRAPEEVMWMEGKLKSGKTDQVKIVPDGCKIANYGFDVTPSRLVTALITERGICSANRKNIEQLFPDLSL